MDSTWLSASVFFPFLIHFFFCQAAIAVFNTIVDNNFISAAENFSSSTSTASVRPTHNVSPSISIVHTNMCF
jgi:hypothetical protein